MTAHRVERDAFGAVELPVDAYWGAQTERSRRLFRIGADRLPVDVVHAFGAQKAAAARANAALGTLDPALAKPIVAAAEEVAAGAFDAHFPLVIWQTGSGTQTNMNANEVIANRANELLGQPLGARAPVHPNDHVNLGQSSNDTFPTIMHVCALRSVHRALLPAIERLHDSLLGRAGDFRDHVKLGKTHLQDALPITLGMEVRTWARQIEAARASIRSLAEPLQEIPQGGTAAGSGLNGHDAFAARVAVDLSEHAGVPLSASDCPSQHMAAHDAFVGLSGGLSTLATAVAKICNDIRLMTSSLGAGPELRLPDDGLSSSIMPGKRNATVCEAVLQVCAKVGANHAAILAGNNGGALQLNTCKPLILSSILDSLTLLADALDVLAEDCIAGLDVDADRLRERVEASAILGTLLAPEIGYDAAARIVRRVMAGECTLREAALEDGAFDGKRFDALLARMLDPATLDRGAAAGAIPTVQEAKR